MAQINLLKQKTAGQNLWEVLPKYLVWACVLVFAGFAVYYGLVTVSTNNIDKEIANVEKIIENNKAVLVKFQNTDELFTREIQLKEFSNLLGRHLYWSQLLPELAKVTLKKATYSSFKISPDNTIALTVNVPSYDDFDKFLQVFDQPKVNSNFSNVLVDNFYDSQAKGLTSIKFNVKMNFNPSLLQYKAANATN